MVFQLQSVFIPGLHFTCALRFHMNVQGLKRDADQYSVCAERFCIVSSGNNSESDKNTQQHSLHVMRASQDLKALGKHMHINSSSGCNYCSVVELHSVFIRRETSCYKQ